MTTGYMTARHETAGHLTVGVGGPGPGRPAIPRRRSIPCTPITSRAARPGPVADAAVATDKSWPEASAGPRGPRTAGHVLARPVTLSRAEDCPDDDSEGPGSLRPRLGCHSPRTGRLGPGPGRRYPEPPTSEAAMLMVVVIAAAAASAATEAAAAMVVVAAPAAAAAAAAQVCLSLLGTYEGPGWDPSSSAAQL